MLDVWMVSKNKPHSFPDTSDVSDNSVGFADQSHHFIDEAQNMMAAFLEYQRSQASREIHKRSSSNGIKSAFNGEDAGDLLKLPGKRYEAHEEDFDEGSGLPHNSRNDKRYLIQNYLLDVNEDCLSLNVYSPLVSLHVTATTLNR